MQLRRQHRRHTAVALGTYQGACLVHARAQQGVQSRMKSTTGIIYARTEINNRSCTRAAEAATQETHCSCTRHVPRRVPRPCPCTTGVMKSTTDHLSTVTHAAEAATQETHCSCTRHVPRRMPRPCPYRTGVMKSRKKHNIY